MIDILADYLSIQNSLHQSLQLKIKRLQQQNVQIQSKIIKISQIVDQIQITPNFINTSSLSINTQSNITNISLNNVILAQNNQSIKNLYINKYLDKNQFLIKDQLNSLKRQQKYVQKIITFVQEYLSTNKKDPSQLEIKIKILRKIIDNISQKQIEKQKGNKQNQQQQSQQFQDILSDDNKDTDQIQSKIIDKLQFFYTKLQDHLKNHLNNLVKIHPNKKSLMIYLKEIKQNQSLLDYKILSNYLHALFDTILSYEIVNKNYQLMLPQIKLQNQDLVQVQRVLIIFSKQQAAHFYTQIINAIQQTKKLLDFIINKLDIIQNVKFLEQEKDQNLIKVRNQIQYILPYFSLQNRKNLLDKLITKHQQRASKVLQDQLQDDHEQYNVFENVKTSDLLVKLKLIGQDGDMLASTLQILSKKLLKCISNKDFKMVINYLQMIQNSKSSLSLGFFIANSLIENLQKEQQNQNFNYQYIIKLLKCRENLRNKIHQPVDQQYKFF